LLGPFSSRMDLRWICFRNVNGHSNDGWNNRADALAVKGRDEQAQQVTIQIAFGAVI
jgi:ribonuclease HI